MSDIEKEINQSPEFYLFSRFMMKFHPKFFSLSDKDQDSYKIENEDEMRFPFKKFLYSELMGITPAPSVLEALDDPDSFYEDIDLPEDILLKMNSASAYLRGIGPNYFQLNESFAENESILTFPTLYDYDLNEHEFQERAFLEDLEKKEKEIPPYLMRLSSRWARCYLKEKKGDNIENKFYYLVLTTVSSYIYDLLENISMDYIDKLIPNEFVEGPNHGKKENGMILWDMKTDANGLEDVLDDLNSANRKYIGDVYSRLKIYFNDNKKNTIWVSDETSEYDPSKFYIFSDQDVLKSVRFDHWQEDTDKFITEDLSFINDLVTEEEDLLLRYLDKEFKQLMENFDPKVKRLKKRNKILMSSDINIDIGDNPS